MSDPPAGLLPASVKKEFQKAVAKCTSCLALTEYLASLGHPDPETHDRAEHALRTTQAALELDRQAQKGG